MRPAPRVSAVDVLGVAVDRLGGEHGAAVERGQVRAGPVGLHHHVGDDPGPGLDQGRQPRQRALVHHRLSDRFVEKLDDARPDTTVHDSQHRTAVMADSRDQLVGQREIAFFPVRQLGTRVGPLERELMRVQQ